MKGRKKYFITCVITMTIVHLLDVLSTWLASPDLKYETHSIVSVYGLGWAPLLLSGLLWQLIITIPTYYHCLVFTHPDYSFRKDNRFISIAKVYFYKNGKTKWLSFIKGFFNIAGYSLYWIYVVSIAIAVLNNILFFFSLNFWGEGNPQQVNKKMLSSFSDTIFFDGVKFFTEIIAPNAYFFYSFILYFALFFLLLLFIQKILITVRSNAHFETSSKKIRSAWVIFFLLGYAFFTVFLTDGL